MTALTAKVTEPAPPPPPGADAPKRRGVELTLLAGAVLISVLGHLYVGLATTGHLPGPAARYATGLCAAALLAHLAVRLRAPYADPLLLPIAVLLNGLGLVLIQRLDVTTPAISPPATNSCGPPWAWRSSCWSSHCSATTACSSATPISPSSWPSS